VVKLDKRDPLATALGPLSNTQKKTWEIMVSPDVDG